jgi:23S rRNA pseudouridine1911/1915/1917 synthase
VHRVPNHDRGTCRSELGRDPQNRLKWASVESGGRNAVTHWEVLCRGDRVSLLECKLETGRTHQIRVHLSEAGWPLVGDRTYTRRDCTPTAALREVIESLDHPLLHARVLGFEHPRSKEHLHFEAPPPPDFLNFCEIAGLSAPQLQVR